MKKAIYGLLYSGFTVFGALAPVYAESTAAQESAQTDPSAISPADSPTGDGEIIVTARKRGESLLAVPVTVTAVTGDTLEERGITNLEGFARTVPQLFLAPSGGSVQGGALGLRGISAGDGNPFGDQAVAFNIDGVVVARSTPRQMSEYDLQQIEVLKGPQSLYYGKNSPGGIVVIRTADPTDIFEAGISATHEVNGAEWRTEGFVSTPITDSLGLRIATQYNDIRGWSTNIATPGTIYSRNNKYEPRESQFGGRLTLKFDNGGPFTARFKFGYANRTGDGQPSNTQRIYCSAQGASVRGNDDCTADDRVIVSNLGTRFATGGPNTVTGATIPGFDIYGDGIVRDKVRQYISGLEINYNVTPTLNLTANTGYYKANIFTRANVGYSDTTAPFNPLLAANSASGMIASTQILHIREVSQELRLTSSFEGPFNFMVGGYYQDQKSDFTGAAAVNAINPIQLFPPVQFFQGNKATSAFGSISFKPVDTIELSGGLRYSREKKEIRAIRLYNGAIGATAFTSGSNIPYLTPDATFTDTSPEATISWRPTNQLTVYGSWKRGFLSGGFFPSGSGTNTLTIVDPPYEQQAVQGFEGGVKSVLLDGALRASFAVFSYDIKGLQVNVNIPGPPTQQFVANAASAYSRGAEANIDWQTPLEGFSLRGALAYNKARYKTFNTSPCYGGQTISLGCNRGLNTANGRFTQQELSGQPLVRAPEWGATMGASYEIEDQTDNKITLAVDANYSSKFFTDSVNTPQAVQPSYWLLDASVHFELRSGLEFSLIGHNLTNTYYFSRNSAVPLGSGPSGVAASFVGDQIAAVSRGRELIVKIGYNF